MVKLAFTICSNNYLAQAKTLGDSLILHNTDYKFVICLVDKMSDQIDYLFFDPHEILLADQVPINGFDDMLKQYNIVELNTAVKPFVFQYLFKKYINTSVVLYLDPDIMVFKKFDEFSEVFKNHNFILTPHFTTAINDRLQVSEEAILNCGLYNLGFLGLNRSPFVFKFLDWWMQRLQDRCIIDFANGLFVDQIWINFVPLYYEGVCILRHPGYNMAYWNLHERKLTTQNKQYIINDNYPLVFYHFSGYNVFNNANISKYQTRFTFNSRPDIVQLFENYSKAVINNNHEQFSKIICYYVEMQQNALNEAKMKAEIEFNERKIQWETENRKKIFKRKIKARLRSILHLND